MASESRFLIMGGGERGNVDEGGGGGGGSSGSWQARLAVPGSVWAEVEQRPERRLRYPRPSAGFCPPAPGHARNVGGVAWGGGGAEHWGGWEPL